MRCSDTAKGADVLTAVLEAAYVRQALMERARQQASVTTNSSKQEAAAIALLRRGFSVNEKELETLGRDAHKRAAQNATCFVREVSNAGWKVRGVISVQGSREMLSCFYHCLCSYAYPLLPACTCIVFCVF